MKKFSVMLLSCLLALACLPVFGGAAEAAAVGTEREFDGSVLNEYYAELAEEGELIDPNSGNVRLSYVYTRDTSAKTTWYGFQFDADGTTTVLARFTSRLVLYTMGGSASVKISAPAYFENANNGNSGTKNLLGADVNTGGFIDVQTEKNGDTETLSTIIASGGMYDTMFCGEPVTIALRKITQADGTVVWNYYESGAYLCTLQFENEVEGFGAWFSNAKDFPFMSDFAVDLDYEYTESDAKTDAAAAYEGTAMEVGSELGFVHESIDTGNGVSYPGFEFTYGDNAVTVRRFSKRVAYVLNKNKVSGDASTNIWIRTKNAGTATPYPEGAVVACTTADSNNLCNNHVATALATPGYTLTYKCAMTEETVEIEGKAYPVYAVYEKENGGEFVHLFDIAFPTDETVKVAPYMFNMTSTKSRKADFFYSGYAGETTEADRDGKVDFSNFAAAGGASVRYDVGSEGLRFSAEISWDLVDAYDSLYEDVTFGVKLVRASDNAEAWIEAVNYTEDFDRGIYAFNGVVANIKQENYGVEYSASIYFRFTAEGQTVTLLSEVKAKTSISAAADGLLAQIEAGLKSEAGEDCPYEISVNGKTGYSDYTQYEADVIAKYATKAQ